MLGTLLLVLEPLLHVLEPPLLVYYNPWGNRQYSHSSSNLTSSLKLKSNSYSKSNCKSYFNLPIQNPFEFKVVSTMIVLCNSTFQSISYSRIIKKILLRIKLLLNFLLKPPWKLSTALLFISFPCLPLKGAAAGGRGAAACGLLPGHPLDVGACDAGAHRGRAAKACGEGGLLRRLQAHVRGEKKRLTHLLLIVYNYILHIVVYIVYLCIHI